MMESSNEHANDSRKQRGGPAVPVIDLGSLVAPSFDAKMNKRLQQHGIAGTGNEHDGNPQQVLQPSLASERRNQDYRFVSDEKTASVQVAASNDNETLQSSLPLKKRKRFHSDTALCNANAAALQSETMETQPINEMDLLDSFDFMRGIFGSSSEEPATMTPEKPKRKQSARDLRLMQMVAARVIQKTRGFRFRPLASPSKKRKITTSPPLPARVSPLDESPRESPFQDSSSSGQPLDGNAPVVVQRYSWSLPHGHHTQASISRAPVLQAPVPRDPYASTRKSDSRSSPKERSSTKPTRSLPLPTRAAPAAHHSAHQSQDSRYPEQGAPYTYGTMPPDFSKGPPFVSGHQTPPTTGPYGPPVPYYAYPTTYGGPHHPYSMYPVYYPPPPPYHYPNQHWQGQQPYYPPHPGAPTKKKRKKKSKARSKAKTTPAARKKQPGPIQKGQPSKSERKEMAKTIQAVNAANGGKNDKAAALATAISRGVTIRPSGKWQAQLYFEGQSRYIGVWNTRAEATLAYEIAREKLNGHGLVHGTKEKSPDLIEAAVDAARNAAFEGVYGHGKKAGVSNSKTTLAEPTYRPATQTNSAKTAGLSNSKTPVAKLIDPSESVEIPETIRAANANGGKNDIAADAKATTPLSDVTQQPSGNWRAQVYFEGKTRFIGVWHTREKAKLAYEIARGKLEDHKARYEGKEESKELSDAAVDAARNAAVEGVKGHGKLEWLS